LYGTVPAILSKSPGGDNKPNHWPIWKILYRRGVLLNLLGERIYDHQIQHAIQQMLKRLNKLYNSKQEASGSSSEGTVLLADWTTTSDPKPSPPYHVAYLCLEDKGSSKVVSTVSESELSKLLDEELCATNQYYDTERKCDTYGPIQVILIKNSAFHDFRAAYSRANAFKMPRHLDMLKVPDRLALLDKHRIHPKPSSSPAASPSASASAAAPTTPAT